MRSVATAVLVLALPLGACDYDPRGRCAAASDCLAGQVCSAGVCSAAPAGPVNRAPAASADGFAVPAGGLLNVPASTGVLANDSDPDGDPLAAEGVDGPSHGVAYLGQDGSLVYVPAIGFTGTDVLTYRASDGTLRSDIAAVTLTVGP
jgi:hypothetical protein